MTWGRTSKSLSWAERLAKVGATPAGKRAASRSKAKAAPVGAAREGAPELALSVRQPYADQIMRGVKKVEYRSRATNVRGRVHIYASMRPARDEPDDGLPRGVLVGTVEIVDCSLLDDGSGFGWHLAKPRRAAKLVRPAKHPQPVFFRPF